MTAKQAILERLPSIDYLAVHELHIIGVSDNAAATRLSELARSGLVESRLRSGTRYKEWRKKDPLKFDETGQRAFEQFIAAGGLLPNTKNKASRSSV